MFVTSNNTLVHVAITIATSYSLALCDYRNILQLHVYKYRSRHLVELCGISPSFIVMIATHHGIPSPGSHETNLCHHKDGSGQSGIISS